MIRYRNSIVIAGLAVTLAACSTGYKAQPIPFRLPEREANVQHLDGAAIAAVAYADAAEARKAFGFDARAAGLLPVQVVFDNRGSKALRINPAQTFLEDDDGNLWPVLQEQFAYDRVTKYVETKKIFAEGAYGGALGMVTGAVIGAAVGVVSGENVGTAAGKGAAAGAAAGAIIGGSQGKMSASDAQKRVMKDFNDKSLRNQEISPNAIAYGFIFFPGEAPSAARLRLQLKDADSGEVHTLLFTL